MYKISLILTILGGVAFYTQSADFWQKKQKQQYQNALIDLQMAQTVGRPVSLTLMPHLDPYQRRQALAHNKNVEAQKVGFTAQRTAQRKS